MYSVKRSLSSTESALVLRDLYDREFNKPYYPPEADIVFSSSLKRDTEDASEYVSIKKLIEEYSQYDILKFYGISIKDFLNLTPLEYNLLIENSKEMMKKLEEEMRNISQDVSSDLSKLKSNHDLPGELRG